MRDGRNRTPVFEASLPFLQARLYDAHLRLSSLTVTLNGKTPSSRVSFGSAYPACAGKTAFAPSPRLPPRSLWQFWPFGLVFSLSKSCALVTKELEGASDLLSQSHRNFVSPRAIGATTAFPSELRTQILA